MSVAWHMVAADGPILLIPMTPNNLNQEGKIIYVSYATLRKIIIDLLTSCLLGFLLFKLCSEHYRDTIIYVFMRPLSQVPISP